MRRLSGITGKYGRSISSLMDQVLVTAAKAPKKTEAGKEDGLPPVRVFQNSSWHEKFSVIERKGGMIFSHTPFCFLSLDRGGERFI